MGGTNRATLQSSPWFATAVANWALCAVADMNGDGVIDLVFQNTVERCEHPVFEGANGLRIDTAPIIYRAAAYWRVVAAGDMNGGGVPDLRLQNSLKKREQRLAYEPRRWVFFSAPLVKTAAPSWKLVGAADINRDGVPDLLFQNQITNQLSVCS